MSHNLIVVLLTLSITYPCIISIIYLSSIYISLKIYISIWISKNLCVFLKYEKENVNSSRDSEIIEEEDNYYSHSHQY